VQLCSQSQNGLERTADSRTRGTITGDITVNICIMPTKYCND
jgi:hypothetical protein